MITSKNKMIKFLILIILIVIILIVMILNKEDKFYEENVLCAKTNFFNKFCFEEDLMIYDKEENTYYFPIDDSLLNKTISLYTINKNKDYKYYINNKELNDKIDFKINLEKPLEYKIDDGEKLNVINIQFTNLPIISINLNGLPTKTYQYGELSLFDKYNLNKNNSFNSNVRMRTRGNSSLFFDKKGYRLEFIDQSKDEVENMLLLEIGYDDDWILDAIYNDPSKIRNKLSTDLWNLINSYNTSKQFDIDFNSKFIELFVNNEYRGLYVIRELANRKKLNLLKTNKKNSGILIKGIDYKEMEWGLEYISNIQENVYENFEMQYPNDSIDYPKYWNIILSKLSKYFNSEATYENLNEIFYIENFIDYILFIEAIRAVDNLGTKNIIFSMQDINSKIMITPWDLDLTFGLNWQIDSELLSVKKYENYNKIISLIMNIKDEKILKLIKDRYKELRKEIITQNTINNLVDTYEKEIYYATLRDSKKWYFYDIKKELNEIKEWFKNRIEFLDTYIEGL